MIDAEFIQTVFEALIPEAKIVSDAPLKAYIEAAKKNPFIQVQMEMGIYDEDNIHDDFISPAVCHAEAGHIIYCSEIMQNMMDGVPDTLAGIWVASVATHEGHHLREEHAPKTWEESLAHEVEALDHGHSMSELAGMAEAQSKVCQRVYARIATLRSEEWTSTT